MRVPINLPPLGFDMESARVDSWHKQVGDSVAEGEVLAEIETEKALVELESPAGGSLAEICFEDGAEVTAGAVLGYIDDGS